jgi:hypothetical protein
MAWLLLLITVLLVLSGLLLYVYDLVGWGQLLFVLASGTAGAAVVTLIDENR